MKSDEYMDSVDATLNIEGMDYDKVLELKNAVSNAEIDYFMIDILRAAHRAIIDNDITSLEDYQSDKAVLPANAAKKRILNLIKIYPERFNIHDRTGFDGLVIDVLALSGGPEGLYLIADIKTSESLYRWMYPPKLPDNPKPDEPDGKVKVTVTCNGATSTSAESVTINEGSDFTALFIPNTDCVFSKITINDQAYTSLKDITSNDGMSLAETNNGYKLILQKVAQDTDIVFTCKYDSTIKTFRVDCDLVGCKPNCELPIVVNEGSSAAVTITGNAGYVLNLLTIDGVDYTGLCNQGVSEFSHGKLTDTKDDDYNVSVMANSITIKFDSLGYDHKIICHYVVPSFMIVGAGNHVKIEPNPAEVLMSQDRVISLTPDEGYEISSIECAVPFTENMSTDSSMVITFENVTQDINYTVIVTKKDSGDDPEPPSPTPDTYYSITGYGDHVSISDNPISAKEGSTSIITITPDASYKIISVVTEYTNASLVQNDTQAILQISNINSDVVYTVRTAPIVTPDPEEPIVKYTVTGTGEHVTLTPATVENVEEHSSVPIIVKVDEEYTVKSINCDATYVFDSLNGILTFRDVTANITYTITTEKVSTPVDPVTPPSPTDEKYTVSGTGRNVTIEPNPIHDIANHSVVSIKLTPDENYTVTDVTTSEEHTLVDNILTFTDVISNIVYVVNTKSTGGVDPEPEKKYTVTTLTGATAPDDKNLVVTSPELTVTDGKYTFKVEENTAATMTLTSGYTTDGQYLTKMSMVTITDTDTSERITYSSVNVSDVGTVQTNLENQSGDIVGSIESSVSENTYTYNVVINKVTQNLTIAFGTTNVNIGQGDKT